MANLIASRVQFTIAGQASDSFNVPQDNIARIFLDDEENNFPVQGMNYLPQMNTFGNSSRLATVTVEYFYSDNDKLFDFSNLPYQIQNLQLLLSSATNTSLAIVSGLFSMNSKVVYNGQGIPVKRQITICGSRVDYFFI